MILDMSQLGSIMAGVMFVCAIVQQLFQRELNAHIEKYFRKVVNYFDPYLHIVFHEYQGDEFQRSKGYKAIERYLSTISSDRAKHLKADVVKDCKSFFLSMDDYEEVLDEFQGIKIWWSSRKVIPKQQALYSNNHDNGKWYFKLSCHRKHRDFVTKVYLHHVLDEGNAIAIKTRKRTLYTNSKGRDWKGNERSMWSHVIFDHPSTFDTLALDPKKKSDILNDLMTFKNSKDYYKKVGKCWKRGYLLYGPPGTGKSSMIAAMANILDYDIYDLELNSVQDNTDLRKLLIDTSGKSIIVIEDIDCSLDLTGKRKGEEENSDSEDEDEANLILKKDNDKKKKKKGSEMTLSGLLNAVDGLWSCCGSEKIIVFTTNHIDKLDSALIRRGRMDMHIELSYCCFESFKVLAKNYLDIVSHELFETIGRLLEGTNMSPADVAENLMPKSPQENADKCLKKLIKDLENAKEAARLKAEEEASKKNDQSKKSEEVKESEDKKSEENGGEVKESEDKKSEENGGEVKESDGEGS